MYARGVQRVGARLTLDDRVVVARRAVDETEGSVESLLGEADLRAVRALVGDPAGAHGGQERATMGRARVRADPVGPVAAGPAVPVAPVRHIRWPPLFPADPGAARRSGGRRCSSVLACRSGLGRSGRRTDAHPLPPASGGTPCRRGRSGSGYYRNVGASTAGGSGAVRSEAVTGGGSAVAASSLGSGFGVVWSIPVGWK